MFFILLFVGILALINGNHECPDLLTYEEKPCTTMRTGMVRHINKDQLQVCMNKQWQPYHPCGSCISRVLGLVGYWKMNEQSGNNVADDSGYENHGLAHGPIPKLSKFSYGRYFNSGGIITIPNAASLNFGVSSFSVSGWLKIPDLKYRMTTFAVKKGYGCHFNQAIDGWVPGWETAHGYRSTALRVCIRDKESRNADAYVELDKGYQPGQLIGQWVHHVVVFDREQQKRAFVYINGKKQTNSLDISTVKGSVDNEKSLEFGTLYGWKTMGTLDEYRVYNKALDAHEVDLIFRNHLG